MNPTTVNHYNNCFTLGGKSKRENGAIIKVPMGTYMKAEDKSAKFHIEGLTAEEVKSQPTVLAPYDTDVYCYLCNRTEHIKAGEPIPVCCGRLMEILD